MLKRPVVFFFLCSLVGGATAPLPALAKDKNPPTYQQGKLLNIDLQKEQTTSYTTTRQSNGTTVTTPTTSEQKHYFITVQAGDLVYVAEYSPIFFGKPGDWVIGDPIDVRLDGNNLFLRKPNGKELKAKIRKKIRATEYSAATPH